MPGQTALETLKSKIPCRHHVVSDSHVSLASFPTVTLPDGTTRVKRVAYLAELRNRALKPLDNLSDIDGINFDKVLFMNDVTYRPLDAAHLLFDTNRGDYLAACALDFFEPHRIYDVYALRDAEGYASYQTLYPFFRKGGVSIRDVLPQKDAVTVKSCWGGMTAVGGEYIQNLSGRQSVGETVIDSDRLDNVSKPVRFRFEPEAFYDACECCLFSTDLRQAAKQDRTGEENGIYVNPYVRVAYNEKVLNWVQIFKRWEILFRIVYEIQSWFEPRVENPWREVEEGEHFTEEIWDGKAWKLVDRAGRSGLFCGVRGMQVLRTENRRKGKKGNSLANTRMPPGQTLSFRSLWGETLPANWRTEYEGADGAGQEEYFYKEYD